MAFPVSLKNKHKAHAEESKKAQAIEKPRSYSVDDMTHKIPSLNQSKRDMKNKFSRSYENSNTEQAYQQSQLDKAIMAWQNVHESSHDDLEKIAESTLAIKMDDNNNNNSAPKVITIKNDSSGIKEPSREFYTAFVTYQKSKSLKTSENPKKFYKSIKELFRASLCFSSGHFLQKLGELISAVPDSNFAKDVIDRLFKHIEKKFKKMDPQCAQKFGDALATVLMNISEQEQKDKDISDFDLESVIERNPTEVALQRTFIKALLADDSARNIYGPASYPLFNSTQAVIWFDHYLQVYVHKKLVTKDQNPDKFDVEKKYFISDEAYQKLKTSSNDYHAAIGSRDPEVYKKIWPNGFKRPFTKFYNSLEQLTPSKVKDSYNSNANYFKVSTLSGKEIEVADWKIARLISYGVISLLKPIFNLWLEDKERNIFDDPELLQESLKKILFDPNFYFYFLPPDASIKYQEVYGELWKARLNQKLKTLQTKAKSDDEVELIQKINQLVLDYKGKNLPSLEFQVEFNGIFVAFKNKRMAKRHRLLLNDPSFIQLTQSLPEFRLVEDKKKQAEEVTLLYDAMMKNKPEILSKLTNQKFAENITSFLKVWGAKLQKIVQKDKTRDAAIRLIELGRFRQTISNMIQKGFKLPVSIHELPTMLKGMQELPDKDLVDFFKNFSHDPHIKEFLNPDSVYTLLNDPKSEVAKELETFMLDEDFLSAHLDILSSLSNDIQKNILFPAKDTWKKFIKVIIQLIQNKNFYEIFDKHWKEEEKMGFRSLLTSIASNPLMYNNYDLFIIYIFHRGYNHKLNPTDETMCTDKTRTFFELFYQLPTLIAAKKITGGDNFTIAPTSEHDGYLKQLSRPMEEFGADGKVKDSKGNEILFRTAIALLDASFVKYDEKENFSRILREPPDKVLKANKEFIEKEIEALVSFLKEHGHCKETKDQRELWHYVLRLSIECSNEKNIKVCLDMIENSGPLNPEDLKKHYNFILVNKKKDSFQIMLDYFGQKPEYQDCVDVLEEIFATSTTSDDKEATKPVLENSISILISSVRTHLPPGIGIVNDSSLSNALENAASLVRLLNNIGTIPLLNPIEAIEKLEIYLETNDAKDFLSLLEKVSENDWSRVIEDIKFGEYNVTRMHNISNIFEELFYFKSNLFYFSQIYHNERMLLMEQIKMINKKIGDKVVGKLILNFVLFHEKLYSTKQGE